MSQYNMKNKTVLITGATDGIGLLTAEKMASAGATVLVHGRNPEKLEYTVSTLKSTTGNKNIQSYKADYSELKQVKQMAEQVLSDHSTIDVLINNAGFLGKTDAPPFLSKDGFEMIFQVNLLALALVTETLLPAIKKAKGRVVNVASAAQSSFDFNQPFSASGYPAYAQSKLAVVTYSQILGDKVLSDGVTVNALDPGSLLNTNMVKDAFGASERSPNIGANAQMLLACSETLTGRTKLFFTEEDETLAHDEAYNKDIQQKLWDLLHNTITNV